jgi:DNA-binding response OmpR family regulator
MKPNAACIVVADTDRTVLELLQIRLEQGGYRVSVSRDSDELLDIVRAGPPAALIIDFNLNGLGAKGVLEHLRRRSQLTFPVLLMGDSMTPEGLQEVMRLGARSCMIKPFSGEDLLERVNWLLRGPPPADRQVIMLDA